MSIQVKNLPKPCKFPTAAINRNYAVCDPLFLVVVISVSALFECHCFVDLSLLLSYIFFDTPHVCLSNLSSTRAPIVSHSKTQLSENSIKPEDSSCLSASSSLIPPSIVIIANRSSISSAKCFLNSGSFRRACRAIR